MIVRMWRGQAKAANADAYERFVTTKVSPARQAASASRTPGRSRLVPVKP